MDVFRYYNRAVEYGELICMEYSEKTPEIKPEYANMSTIELSQECFVGDKAVEQSLILNQSRELVGIRFVLHPERQLATIRYNQI